MNSKIKKYIVIVSLLILISISGCGSGVSVGVGVYVPGPWVGPYPGYYPPIGIGYPRF